MSSPTPSRWVTFYPRSVFFPSSASVEEIPQEFVNHFRGGFLHDVSQRTRPFPSFSAPVPEDGARGIGSQEVRISSFRVHRSEIFTRQGRRAVIQLGFCVFANSRVPRFSYGFLSLSLSLAKIAHTYACSEQNHLYNYEITACPALIFARLCTSNKLLDIHLYQSFK